jgi:hypothetical protein
MKRHDIEKLADQLARETFYAAAENLPFGADQVAALNGVMILLQDDAPNNHLARAIAIQALADHTELDDFYYERILDKAGDDRE